MFEVQLVERPAEITGEPGFDQNVLVQTPDRDMSGILRYTLDTYGFRTILCLDAAEALRNRSIRAFDCILLDCTLDAASLEQVIRLRRRFPLAIIICTGDADAMVPFLEAGATDFIPKPLVPFEFAMMITGGDICC